MFAIVENENNSAWVVGPRRIGRGPLALSFTILQCGDRPLHLIEIRVSFEVDESGPVFVRPDNTLRQRERDRGLSNSAGSDDRDEAMIELLRQSLHCLSPSDQTIDAGGQSIRQVVLAGFVLRGLDGVIDLDRCDKPVATPRNIDDEPIVSVALIQGAAQ